MCPVNIPDIRILLLGIAVLSSRRNHSIVATKDTINIGFLAEYSQMRVTLGGLPLAVEDVNKNVNLLPGKTLTFTPFDIGNKMSAYRVRPLRFMTEMREKKVKAFIGPDEGCTTEALLASAWNTPMLSFVSKSVISLLKAYDWKKFAIVVSSKPIWGSDVASAIQELAEARNFTITHFKYISDYIPIKKTLSQIENIIEETYQTTRIYVFIGEHIAMVDFVRGLQNRKLLESGDYIVISVDDEIYNASRRVNIMERNYLDPYIRKEKSKSLDKISFRSVIKISMTYPQNPHIRDICAKIKEYARKAPFLVPYHQRVFENISVPIYGLHLYDSVMIYARAITEILQLGGDINDGSLVMSHIFNRSYHSIQGFDVFIDSNGDAEGNYTVITLQSDTNGALFRGNIVAMKKIHKKNVDITRSIRKELKLMREVRHENIINFIGASIDHGSVIIFTTYCARGSLEDVLANEDLHLDHMFISSLVSDILKGMIYLHDSEIISHGNLRSSNCLIDSRWVCQISDFGLHELKAGQDEPNKLELELKRALTMAPELLRDPYRPARGSQKGDIYSFGILLYEMIGRKGSWGETAYTNEEIIEFVKSPDLLQHGVFRPALSCLDIPNYLRQCLRLCWEEDPEVRPDIRLVRMHLKELQAGLKPNIFDNMLAIMEKYAYNLEGLVQERTNLLYEEKKKTDMLLYQMLPKTVAELLKSGDPVKAECFDCVTILFSDIVGFTELCTTSTPFEVVEMLNDLYTCCDSIISNYDVYKVETIGDAYMVVSGLPLKNGNRHAGEIASLALHLLETVRNLKIRHKPTEMMQFRIGLHSGPCAAGVVGQKMPRYCLFGDTVNTASRMESTGEAMKIHISEVTNQLLQDVGGYICVERGLTSIKGKGDMRTYWLIKRVQPEMRSLMINDWTPDLISTVDASNSCCAKTRGDDSTLLQLTNLRTGSCNCATKSIYSRRSDDNVTSSLDASVLQKINDPVQINCNQLCVCRLNGSQVFNNRGPRSAPSITFRL
ncbi:hypothetical protein ACLKA6_018263 [Drosophila palustris]